jgi:hypothetical protein
VASPNGATLSAETKAVYLGGFFFFKSSKAIVGSPMDLREFHPFR